MKNKAENCDTQKDEKYYTLYTIHYTLYAFSHTVYQDFVLEWILVTGKFTEENNYDVLTN